MDLYYKVKVLGIFSLILTFMFAGCSTKNTAKTVEINQQKQFKTNSQQSSYIYENNQPKHIPPLPSPTDLITGYEKIDPLKEKRITINAINAPLKQVLYSIANDLGMNLVVSPDVDINQQITLNLNNVIAKDTLDIIRDLADISYKEKNNILYIKSTETKIFYIPYIQALSSYNVDLGGDVLGSIGTSGGGGFGGQVGGVGGYGGGGYSSGGTLTGNFSLKYEKDTDLGDFYSQFEENIKNLLSNNGKYTFNRMTGTLIVTDKVKNIKRIEKFLQKLKKELQKQVLIEAKIVEVYLNDSWSYGIDWSALFAKTFGDNRTITLSQTLALPNSAGQLVVTGLHFNAILNALAQTGKVETLSSPRIRVLNGQNALISTGTVTPYWEKQINTLATTGTSQQQVSYIRSSVLDGILLGVSPFINDDGTITLNIIPVSTKIRGEKQLLDNNQVVAQAPIIELKEAGTVVRVKDGNTVIIGGLISTDKQTDEKKVPLLGDIPYIGNLFKQKSVSKQKKELIIFLIPRIIKGVE